MTKVKFRSTLRRLHGWAGLFVVPFILILSATGSIYLFKPQLDRWQESDWRGLPVSQQVSAEKQVRAALAVIPKGVFQGYRLPESQSDAAMVQIALVGEYEARNVYVAPDGSVLATVDPESTISATVGRIHSTLLLGKFGSTLVEIAATLAIFMILSGLYLCWPARLKGLASLRGIAWPRVKAGVRVFWRDLHAVTGFWIAGLALVLLVSGLPWTDNWGAAIRSARDRMGWVDTAPQDWAGGETSASSTHHHDRNASPNMLATSLKRASASRAASLDDIVWQARSERMPYPAVIQPPGAPTTFGPPNGSYWKLTSDTQNRPLVRSVFYDPEIGNEVARIGFSDRHLADRIIGYGIAWHEGQLFGWMNQMVGLLTAIGLMTIAVSGIRLWWRTK